MPLHAAQHAREASRRVVVSRTACRSAGGNHAPGFDSHSAYAGCNVMGTALIDNFGRLHDSLRISVTDRCNIRCFYCMPEEAVQYAARREILTFEEIERFVRVAATLGINKLRLTGADPLLRRDLPQLIARLASVPGIHDLAL